MERLEIIRVCVWDEMVVLLATTLLLHPSSLSLPCSLCGREGVRLIIFFRVRLSGILGRAVTRRNSLQLFMGWTVEELGQNLHLKLLGPQITSIDLGLVTL